MSTANCEGCIWNNGSGEVFFCPGCKVMPCDPEEMNEAQDGVDERAGEEGES